MSNKAMHLNQPDSVVAIQKVFSDLDITAYLVGGSVRDLILGLTPHDLDFTTPIVPDEVESKLKAAGYTVGITGKRFGTITATIKEEKIEITTFRADIYTPGSRKPTVRFVSDISQDLRRRDFTVNAIALRPDGRIVDPFGGVEDIAQRRLRAVGSAGTSFTEDPLRMLRAARLCSQLGFEVVPDTEKRALQRSPKILEISSERWTSELDRLLLLPDPTASLEFLARTRLLMFMIPELYVQVGFDQDSPYHELGLWEHTLKTVRLVSPTRELRWAALLHDVGKGFTRVKNDRGYSNYSGHEIVGAELVDKIGRYLHWSNAFRETVTSIVRLHLEPDSQLHDADTSATKRD